jgi:hypothetical protein
VLPEFVGDTSKPNCNILTIHYSRGDREGRGGEGAERLRVGRFAATESCNAEVEYLIGEVLRQPSLVRPVHTGCGPYLIQG